MEEAEIVNRRLSIFRYFTWSEELREEYGKARREKFPAVGKSYDQGKGMPYAEAMHAEMYMHLWFSMLYVVIEGWQKLKTGDDVLSPLLRSPCKDLLRRFRNSTFHPDDLMAPKSRGLVQKGEEAYVWVEEVQAAFRGYFRDIREAESLL